MNIIGNNTTTSLSFAQSTDGLEIAFKVIGAGIPVLCLHGFTESHECWEEAGYVEPLVTAGYQVVLIDSRGHGQSGKPHDADAYSGSRRIGDLEAVMDVLGCDKVVLLGHSMGGVLALATAGWIPQRLHAAIVVGAHPFPEVLASMRRAIRSGLSAWIEHLERQAGWMSPRARQRIEANDLEALSACAARDRADISGQLAENAVPLLMIVGSEDERLPAVVAADGVPNTAIQVVDGLNHCTSFIRSDRTVPIILNFLRGIRE